MEITYKKDINHTYIVFQGEKVLRDTFQTQMLLHNLVEGILPCSIVSINEEDAWQCECTGLHSLDVYCKTKELGKDDFVWIVQQILENIQEVQDYLLDVNSLYLVPEYIYIDPKKNKILCSFVPFFHCDIWNSLKQMLQFLFQYLNPQDEGIASMAYGLFRLLSNPDCSMEGLWAYLYERQYGKESKKTAIYEKDSNLFAKKQEGNKGRQSSSVKDEERDIEGLLFAASTETKRNEAFPAFTEDKEQQKKAVVPDVLLGAVSSRNPKKNVEVPDAAKEGEKASWIENIRDPLFWKKTAYVFPAMVAVLLFLYLVFNSWMMSGKKLLSYAGVIVGFQLLSIILYWCWGREAKEENPLLKEYESEKESVLDISRKKPGEVDKKPEKADKKIGKPEHWSEEFERRLFRQRSFGFSEGDGSTVLLNEAPLSGYVLCRVDTKEQYEIKEGETILGKSRERAQLIVDEPTVSRIHALLTRKGDICFLQDLNSKNGTYINGERLAIRTDYRLHPGDEIIVSSVRMQFQ